jgi:hypothetical protein
MIPIGYGLMAVLVVIRLLAPRGASSGPGGTHS